MLALKYITHQFTIDEMIIDNQYFGTFLRLFLFKVCDLVIQVYALLATLKMIGLLLCFIVTNKPATNAMHLK